SRAVQYVVKFCIHFGPVPPARTLHPTVLVRDARLRASTTSAPRLPRRAPARCRVNQDPIARTFASCPPIKRR
ncbi:hypothetical protein PybrP1_009241, partial [[Pythium] brassicae (nom. inval.)]